MMEENFLEDSVCREESGEEDEQEMDLEDPDESLPVEEMPSANTDNNFKRRRPTLMKRGVKDMFEEAGSEEKVENKRQKWKEMLSTAERTPKLYVRIVQYSIISPYHVILTSYPERIFVKVNGTHNENS